MLMSFGLVLPLNGCTLLDKTLSMPISAWQVAIGNGNKTVFDPVDLQEELLRYADNMTSAVIMGIDHLEKDGKPLERATLLNFRVILAIDFLTNATGANALSNLVDLMILTTAGRIRVETYWMPYVYGDSARSLLDAFKEREAQIWKIGEKIFQPQQISELKETIEEWRKRTDKLKRSALPVFASVGLVNEVTGDIRRKKSYSSSSVFSLLDLDPLAGLDPATRELAQTRLFAERALFIGERMPQILQWQAELTILQAANVPQVNAAVDAGSKLAESGDRISRTVEQLPGIVSSERVDFFKALDAERVNLFNDIGRERQMLLGAVQGQQPGLLQLSKGVGDTMAEGTRMMAATDTTLKSFRGVLGELEKKSEVDAKGPKKEPFRIKEYGDAAAEISRAAEQLTMLLNSLQPAISPENIKRLSAEVDTVTARTEARGQAVVDYAFVRGLQLLAAATVMILTAALAYHYLTRRWSRVG